MPASIFLVVILLLSSLSSSSGQSPTLNVSVSSQYTAVQTAGVPPLLTQSSPQSVVVNRTDDSSQYPYYYYYDNMPTAQIKSAPLTSTHDHLTLPLPCAVSLRSQLTRVLLC